MLNKGNKHNLRTQTLSQREYVSWMQNPANGFCKINEMDDLIFMLQYRSYDYIICKENKGTPLFLASKKERYDDLKGMEFFELTVKLTIGSGELLKYKLSSSTQYSSRVQYFAFDMQKDIQIKFGSGEKQPCVLFLFERTYDIAPYAKFLIGFEKKEENSMQDIIVEYNDRIFDKGLIKFIFIKDDFNKLPKLQTDR
jgi:hypothetical protein